MVRSGGRDSSVGIATRYGLDGQGIESRWGRDFPHPFRPSLGSTKVPIQWVPGLSRGKAAGTWRWPPTPSSIEVKERVKLYLYSPSGPSFFVLGWTLPLLLLVRSLWEEYERRRQSWNRFSQEKYICASVNIKIAYRNMEGIFKRCIFLSLMCVCVCVDGCWTQVKRQ